ncbi:KH domain-containing protein [Candidatus Daviesbacteria bacterium]|nr:KH domain-containing protein [Candidatus Daviesbacteria bacterium]
MEQQLSEVLDNILGLLLLEGSYEIEETEDGFIVSIETQDAGRLIGVRGESLDALQLIINQIMSRGQKIGEFKRMILDVSGWRKQREEDLKRSAEDWGKQVLDSGKEMELEPMSSWQRRVVHMVVGEMKGLETESLGEGRDRHVVIKLKSQNSKLKTKKEEPNTDAETKED